MPINRKRDMQYAGKQYQSGVIHFAVPVKSGYIISRSAVMGYQRFVVNPVLTQFPRRELW